MKIQCVPRSYGGLLDVLIDNFHEVLSKLQEISGRAFKELADNRALDNGHPPRGGVGRGGVESWREGEVERESWLMIVELQDVGLQPFQPHPTGLTREQAEPGTPTTTMCKWLFIVWHTCILKSPENSVAEPQLTFFGWSRSEGVPPNP